MCYERAVVQRRRALPVIALAGVLLGTAARADPPARSLVEADAQQTELWRAGFLGVYTAALAMQSGFALAARDEGRRVDALVAATSAALGVGSMVITPMGRVPSLVDEARRTGDWDRAALRIAEAESLATAWYNHLLCAAVAVTAGAVLWLGFDRPGTAAFSFASSLVAGELNLWLIPRRAMRRRAAQTWHVAPTGSGLVVTW